QQPEPGHGRTLLWLKNPPASVILPGDLPMRVDSSTKVKYAHAPAPAVAVIGCGYWGKNLVRTFNALGALTEVCDMTPAGRAAAAQLAPQARITADVERVWDGEAS